MTARWDRKRYSKISQNNNNGKNKQNPRQPNGRKKVPRISKRVRDTLAVTVRSPTKTPM